MIRVEPFRVAHVSMLADPKEDPGFHKAMAGREHYWKFMELSGTAFSAYDGDTFLGCAGIAITWDGVAEGWVWALPSVSAVSMQVHRLVARGIKHLEETYGIKRLSVEVRKDNTRAERWVKALGFSYECDMRKRGPQGETMMLYARVKE